MSSTAGLIRLPPLVWMYLAIFGISSTWDCAWRANSRSTCSSSLRIGSNICDRAGAFSTVAQVETLSRAEQRAKVCGGSQGNVRRVAMPEIGQSGDYARDVGRLVPFAPIRDRGKKRAVGFGQHRVGWQILYDVTQ